MRTPFEFILERGEATVILARRHVFETDDFDRRISMLVLCKQCRVMSRARAIDTAVLLAVQRWAHHFPGEPRKIIPIPLGCLFHML